MNMSNDHFHGCKKRKRLEERLVYKFATFGERGYPVEFNGSFHENVRALLDFGVQVEKSSSSESTAMMTIWSFQLEHGRRHPLLVHNSLILFVIEELIDHLSPHYYHDLKCKHCKYIGWGNHMTCNKKYHFVLSSKTIGYNSVQGENCKSTSVIIDQLLGDRRDHNMYGVFHSNGFGHLQYINGFENGSDLAGYQIMDFWDRLCSRLRARKVSLKDVALKKGMDLRLLHTVAYDKPWFGRWGYTFGRGSFGIDQQMYQSAVKAIRDIPLSTLPIGFHHNNKNEIQIILSRYQTLSNCTTLGDLFHFMLQLKLQFVPSGDRHHHRYPAGIMSDASCRWSPKRVEMAVHVVVQALKQAQFRWVSRQHVRDVSRAYIGDTGLLDFVLKSLGNHIVGNYFVRRCLNPVTKVLEYCLEDVSPNQQQQHLLMNPTKISWPQLIKDISYMYQYIHLQGTTTTTIGGVFDDTVSVASRIILDIKHFVKQYSGDFECNHNDDHMTNYKQKIYCAIIPHEEKVLATPYHCVVLNNSATFDELKFEVEKIFRETYLGLKNFTAATINNIRFSGSDLVFKTIKPGSKIALDHHIITNIRDEMSNFMVDCICGTNDDDGERMVCCDICQVWQHTRCVQIPETDHIPNIFLCITCENQMLRFPNLP